ncbi:MAG: hypothetical protein ABIO48_06985 [Pedococcus sp.]
MSTGRKRKKAARQQSVAQWRATTSVVPARPDGRQTSHTNGSAVATATEPLTSANAVHEPVVVPREGLSDRAAAPPDDPADPRPAAAESLSNQATAAPDIPTDPTPTATDALEDQYDWEDRYGDDRTGQYEEQEVVADDPASRRVRRRRAVAVAVGAPLLFVGAFAASGWIMNAAQDEPSTADQTVVPSPTAPSSSAPVAPPRSGNTSYVPGAAAGPGQTEPGALVRATPSADGSLEVVERVRFADPVTELSLGPPLTKGVMAKSIPTGVVIADLQVQADDAIVDIGVRSLATARTVELSAEASTVIMRYRLTGATVRSIPSTPGRALAVLPPITQPATLGSTPFVIEVSGAQVTNVLCPGLPTAAQLCGRTWARGWYLSPQQPGRTAVLAQLTLPDPGSS